MVTKNIIIAMIIISMFLVSSCDVYNTLFIKETEAPEDTEEVSDDDIFISIDVDEELDDEGNEDVVVEDEEETEDEDIEEVDEEKDEEEVEVTIEDDTPVDATVIIVEENELISLVPKAEDPDQDELIFTFTSPLDDNGEWQTNYGDAGEYTITVTASDGELTTSQAILVIVNKKEEPPVIESFEPESDTLEIEETEELSFEVKASDLNDDVLIYTWKLDGINVGEGEEYGYSSTYEDSGSHTVKVSVSDGVSTAENLWSVTVNNKNRPPTLEEIDDIEAGEGDEVVIELDASDDDNDDLTYSIDNDNFEQDGSKFTWETTYDDAGTHTVIVSVSDGVDETSQSVSITLENVNRAPVILDIVQKE